MSACDRLTGHYTAQGSRRDPLAKFAAQETINHDLRGFICGVGGPNGRQQEPFRIRWATLAAKMAQRHSKRRPGGERRRAPNVTHTVVSETRAPEVREIVIYFEHRVKMRKVVPDQGAPNATHSVISGT